MQIFIKILGQTILNKRWHMETEKDENLEEEEFDDEEELEDEENP